MEKKGKRPRCDKCKMPVLLSESLEAYYISREALAGTFDGMGALKLEVLKVLLEANGFRPGTVDYKILFRRCYYYLHKYLVTTRKKDSYDNIGEGRTVLGGGKAPPRRGGRGRLTGGRQVRSSSKSRNKR